jgi:hypothetical protein
MLVGNGDGHLGLHLQKLIFHVENKLACKFFWVFGL